MPFAHTGRLATLGLAALVAACALAPAAVSVPGPPAGAGDPAAPQVKDAAGPLPPRRAAGVVRRLAELGETDLLASHLAQVEQSLAAPLILGNRGRLLIDGPQTHGAMLAAMAAARRHIHLETYILAADEAGERLARLLAAKRAEGVEVRVLYDGVGSLATPRDYFRRLAAAGVALCEFNPVNPLAAKGAEGWRINNRDHRKILVVDSHTAFTGGINISGVYRSSSFARKHQPPTPEEGWRDTHVQVSGPIVGEFQRLFLNTWKNQRCSPKFDSGAGPAARQTSQGDMPMRLVAADPEAGRSEFYLALLSAIANAGSRVWLTYGYFVPDQRMLHVLKAAAGRGVDVRLVLPGFSDFWAPFHAGRSRYAELLAAGVSIFERRDALLHAKTAVIDGVWSSIGSTNLDWRSFVHNYEADLLVLDLAFAGQLEGLFRLDQAASQEITQEAWQRRGLGPRLKEWLARRWEYLL